MIIPCWWGWQELNLRPIGYEPTALTAELHPRGLLDKTSITDAYRTRTHSRIQVLYNFFCTKEKTHMKNFFKELLTLNSLVYFLAVSAAFLLVWQTTKVTLENYSLQKRVDELQQEVEILELENQAITYSIQYYKTDSYKELAARENFNLKSPGESVLYVPRATQTKPETSNEASSSEVSDTSTDSNINRWLYFLFGIDPS